PAVLQDLIPPGGNLADDVTYDYLIDSGRYWVGSAETVYQRIVDYHERCGGFGLLLVATGLPVAPLATRLASMERFMADVAPRLAGLTSETATDHAPAVAVAAV